jgi:hypothetical protein
MEARLDRRAALPIVLRKRMPTGYYSAAADDTSGHEAEQALPGCRHFLMSG